jgi:hypothetical protein
MVVVSESTTVAAWLGYTGCVPTAWLQNSNVATDTRPGDVTMILSTFRSSRIPVRTICAT